MSSFGRMNLSASILAFFALAVGFGNLQADVVVPNANETVDAPTANRHPLLVNGGLRFQQVYGAGEFGSFASGGEWITGMWFRPDNGAGSAFGPLTITDVNVSMSTTFRDPDDLHFRFSNNVGADVTTVFDGDLTISSSDSQGPGNTREFDIYIGFSTPFLYDPTLGNLLFDIRIDDPSDNNIGVFFDASNRTNDAMSRLFSGEGSPGDETGSFDSIGIVTKFKTTIIPEPNSVATIASLFFAATFIRRRRTHAK